MTSSITYLFENGIRAQDYLEDPLVKTEPFCRENAEALFKAIKSKNFTEVQGMLKTDKSLIFEYDFSYKTPFHWTVFVNSIEGFKMLLKFGRNINMSDHQGKMPLHVACKKGNEQMISVLY